MDEEIIGVVYALPLRVIRTILDKEKTIFVKNIPYVPTKKSKVKLMEGMKIYFYESGGSKAVHGYAIVKKIEYLLKDEILKRYKTDLMISSHELDVYCLDRKDRKLMVIQLAQHRIFSPPITIKVSINMGGRYLTKENWQRIFPTRGDSHD